MRIIAIILALVFAIIALVYWVLPAGSLPTSFPASKRAQATSI